MSSDDDSPEAKAVALILAVRAALARGCIHRDKAGRVLETPLAIVECLRREGRVEVEEPR